MANSVDPDQTAPTLFASMLNLSVMLGNYLQQTTADDIFRCIFSWHSKGYGYSKESSQQYSYFEYLQVHVLLVLT